MAGFDELLNQWKQEQTTTFPPAGTTSGDETFKPLLDQWKSQEQFGFSASINNAVKYNPDTVARNRQVAQSTGLPADVVERNEQEADRLARISQIRSAAARSPILAQQLSDVEFAKLASSDAEHLATLDGKVGEMKRVWRDVIAPTPARAWSQFVQGTGGIEQWIGETLGADALAKHGIEMVQTGKDVDKQIALEHPLEKGSWSEAGASALSSMYLQAPFMALGTLAGGVKAATATSLGLMGGTTAGATYGERRAAGVGQGASSLSALWDGAVEVGTELLPTKTLFSMMRPVAKQTISKMILQGATYYGEEMVGESLATFLQDANAKVMGDPNLNATQRVNALSNYITSGEAYDNWISTLKSTAIQSTLMGAGGMGVNRLQQKRFASQAALIDTLTATEEIKLRQSAPEVFANRMQEVADHHGVSTVYLQADQLVNAAVQFGITEQDIPAYVAQYGVTPEQLTTALQTNGLLEMGFGEVTRGFANDDLLKSLQTELLVDPNTVGLENYEMDAQTKSVHYTHLDELFQQNQAKQITHDDIAAWEQAILNTPGLKGRVTTDSLMPLIARANVVARMAQEKGIDYSAIEHLNKMLQPTGLQAMKFKEWEAGQKEKSAAGPAAPPTIDWSGVYDALVHPDNNTSTVVKGDGRPATDSTFTKIFSQQFPSLFDTSDVNRPQANYSKGDIQATVKNLRDGKTLTAKQQEIADRISDDINNMTSLQESDFDLPFQRDKNLPTPPVVTLTGIELGNFGDDIKALRKAAIKWYQDVLQDKVVAHNDVIGDVTFTQKGRNEIKTYSANPDKLKLVPALQSIIENGNYVTTEEPDHVRSDGVFQFHLIEANVQIGDKLFHVLVDVAEDNRGNKFYELFPSKEDHDRKKASRRVAASKNSGAPEGFQDIESDATLNIDVTPASQNVKTLFQSAHRQTQPFKRWSNEAPFVSSSEAMNYDFKSGEKVVVESFHGTGRPDRVGTRFQKKRATSGPMAFFTSNPEMASGYAQGKPDTSLSGEDQSYETWFKYKPQGSRSSVDIIKSWYFLDAETKQTIFDRMGDIRQDDDGNIIYEEGGGDPGSYQWELQQTQRGYDRRGNPLKAAVETWLNSGAIFNEERDFLKVLKLAGFPVNDLKYDSPHETFPSVYKTYIAMQSPLVTNDIPQNVVDALNAAAKKDRSRAKQHGADAWDKNIRTLKEWVSAFNEPNNDYVWTSIPDKVTDVFRSLGYDGIIDMGGKANGEKHKVYIPFEEYQVKSAIGNKGTYDINKNDILKQGGNNPLAALSITGSGENLVTLFEKADKSSFLHETAHIFLNDLRYVAEELGVQTAEWERVKEWLGVGEDGVISRDMHEKFAEHFEVYLKNGQAPSIELRNSFRKFKSWLTKIYEAFTSPRQGQRDITVNPELADLFDRLLATEQEIEAAREQAALIAMLDDKLLNGSNFTPEQIAEYRRIVGQAEDSGKEKRDKFKLMGREDRVKGWREQAEREARTVPVYGFQEWMAEQGIDRASTEQYGRVPDAPVWKKDGLDINVAIAENGQQFGYENAAQFIDDLRNSPTKGQWIQKRMAQLEVEHDMQQDTQEAIRTASLRRQLEIESEWLAKQIEKQETVTRERAIVTPREVMRQWAQNVVAGRTVRQIQNVGKLLAESRSHRQQSIALARQGKWEDALKSNEQARLTEALIAESYRAMNAWNKMSRRWQRIAKWSNDNKKVKAGTRFRDQINRLLDQYGIAGKDYDPAAPDLHSFVDGLTGDDLESMGTVLAEWIGRDTDPYTALNWERLQDLDDAFKFLYGHGNQEIVGLRLADGQRVDDYSDSIQGRMSNLKELPELKSEATKIGKILNGLQRKYRKFFANTGILRFIAKRADGYSGQDMGPAEQLVQRIISGMASVNDHWEAINLMVEPELRILMKNGKEIYDDLPLPEVMRRKGEVWTKEKVVAAMLNTGNDSNFQRLMDGYGLRPDQIDAMAAKLTSEEWKAIQKVWDAVNTLWPMIADTHERLNYFRPKKIDARRMVVTTADGQVELAGGYYPVSYDKDKSRTAREHGAQDDIIASQQNILQKPVPKAGATKARADKVNRPLNLSLSVLGSHFTDMLKYIHLSEAVRDADRVFRKGDLSARMEDVFGQDMVDMIRPTLVNVLRPAPSDLGIFEKSRVAMSIYYMGYNAWTAMQNITGVFPAIRQAGFNNYLNGIMHVIGNPYAAYKAMLEASSYMRLREANVERDMKKQLRDFSVQGIEINGTRYTYDDVKSLGFAGIRLIDGMVSLPAWWGVYNAQMNEHGDVKKATDAADAAINKALGSGLAIDQTAFGRHGFFSLLAPFMSFASTQQEVLATEREAWKQGKISTSEFLYGHLMTWVAPAMMSTFLQGALMYGIVGAVGGGGDDRKKKDGADYLTDLLSYRLMGIPFVRDIYNWGLQGFEHKSPVTSARMPATEGYKMVGDLAYKIGNLDGSEKTTKAAMWSAAELASLASGIPATRIYDRYMKGQTNIEDGSGWWGNHFIPQEKKK